MRIKLFIIVLIIFLVIVLGYSIYNSDRNVCVRQVKASKMTTAAAWTAILNAGSFEAFFDQKVADCLAEKIIK